MVGGPDCRPGPPFCATPVHGGAIAIVIVLAAFLAGAARFAWTIDDPWDRSLASLNATIYYGRIEQCYRRLGFFEVRGEPLLNAAPTVQPEYFPYLHHPPCFAWMTHAVVSAVGFSERAFRLVPIFFSSATVALIAALLARHAGWKWATGGVAVYLSVPMGYIYGWMPDPETVTLFLLSLTLLLHDRFRAAPARRYGWVVLAFIAATAMDWQGYFAAPAIVIDELLRRDRFRRRVLLLFPIGVASFAAVLALFAWWVGGTLEAFELIRETAQSALSAGEHEGWLSNQLTFWNHLYTWPVAVFAAAGLPVCAFLAWRRRDPLARYALVSLVPAVLSVVLFPEHSATHEYWWYYALPYAVLSLVVCLRPLERWPLVPAGIVLCCVAVGIAATVRICRECATTGYRDIGERMNAIAGPKDALITAHELGPETFYIHAWTFIPWAAGDAIRFLQAHRTDKRRVERVVYLVTDGILPSLPPELVADLMAASPKHVGSGAEGGWVLVFE